MRKIWKVYVNVLIHELIQTWKTHIWSIEKGRVVMTGSPLVGRSGPEFRALLVLLLDSHLSLPLPQLQIQLRLLIRLRPQPWTKGPLLS